MAATLDPKFSRTVQTNPLQSMKTAASNPTNAALTAAVAAAKPVTLPTMPSSTNVKTTTAAVSAGQPKSPLSTMATSTPAANPAPANPATGALNYNTATAAQKQGMQDNWTRLNNDSDYLASEIARAQAKIAAPGTSAQDAASANDYLTRLTGISSGSPTPTATGTGTSNNFGLPSDLSWLGANASNEVASQIEAYRGQQEAARLAAQAGVDQNNQYLAEQIKQFQQQQAVAQDALQQQQNRFGGLYSGGLNYQGGQINSSFANQQGALSRDIAARNQQLMDQYGTQANTIASQIQNLQANEPGIIRDRINDYLTQYAGLYGSNPLNPNQSTVQGKQANWNAYVDATGLTGNTGLGPTNTWSNLIANGNAGSPTYQAQQQEWQNNYQVGRDKTADAQWQQEFNQRASQYGIQNALSWAQQTLDENKFNYGVSQDQLGTQEAPQTAQDLRTYYDSMAKYDDKGVLTNGPSVEESILSQPNLSDYDAYQLYLRYGLNWNGPIPTPGK